KRPPRLAPLCGCAAALRRDVRDRPALPRVRLDLEGLKESVHEADLGLVAAIRRFLLAVAVLAAAGGFAARGAFAAPPPLPACPAGGPNHLASAHFTVAYNGDQSSADYVTETQAGD